MSKSEKTFQVGGREYHVDEMVAAEVEWPGGRVTHMTGKLITVVDGRAYLRTSFGNVDADAETLEPA